MTLDEERQERSRHLVLRCDMYIEDIKSEIDFILGQPKREWVGLTDDEMKKAWYETKSIMGWYSFEEIARLVEAKLKEKNT